MIRTLGVLIFVVILAGCEKKRQPARFLIPASYEGVVITVYNQHGFPKLPVADGFLVHKYPDDGILITSSEPEYGAASDETIDVFKDGTKQRLLPQHSGRRSERFAATGFKSGIDNTQFVYYFKAIGSDEYWKDRDGREYDKKVEEAMIKISRIKQQSEQVVAPDR